MYIYFNVIYFASVAKICRLEFGIVPTVWYICFVLFYFIVFEETYLAIFSDFIGFVVYLYICFYVIVMLPYAYLPFFLSLASLFVLYYCLLIEIFNCSVLLIF